ncbi:MAG: anthranilate phosphoribosyltransferase, partial [bacterium]
SLTNDTKIITRSGEEVLSPEVLGKRRVFAEDLFGGETTDAAAAIFRSILEGRGSWAQNAVVLANAAVALRSTGRYSSHEEAYAAAVESLDSGRALDALNKLIALQ